MTTHLPEHSYLVGEREAEMEEVGDGRELWNPIDNNLLYTAEELNYAQEYESEYIAETGSDIFLAAAPRTINPPTL